MIPRQVYLTRRRFSLRSPEWSLIIFTVFTQLAVGAVIFLSTAFGFSITKLESSIPKDYLVKFLLFVILIIVIALLTSFFHLGKPKNSIYAVTHFSSSWLSREIIFALLFTISLCLLSFTIYKFQNWMMVKQTLLIAVVIFGLITIYSMIKVYMLPTVPAWNSFSTPLRFFSTAIILGGISVVIFIALLNKQTGIVFPVESAKLVKIILLILALTAVLNLAAYLFHLFSLKDAGLAGLESYKLILDVNSILFYLWSGLSFISVVLLIYFGVINNQLVNFTLAVTIGVGLLVVEIIGRYLFYAYYARVGI